MAATRFFRLLTGAAGTIELRSNGKPSRSAPRRPRPSDAALIGRLRLRELLLVPAGKLALAAFDAQDQQRLKYPRHTSTGVKPAASMPGLTLGKESETGIAFRHQPLWRRTADIAPSTTWHDPPQSKGNKALRPRHPIGQKNPQVAHQCLRDHGPCPAGSPPLAFSSARSPAIALADPAQVGRPDVNHKPVAAAGQPPPVDPGAVLVDLPHEAGDEW